MKKGNKTAKIQKQQRMWDYLIPLLFVICLHPFIVRLAIYSCGYAGYEWYAGDDLLADFYTYYKSYLLDICGFFCAVILAFKGVLEKESMRSVKVFWPLFAYIPFVILSTMFSVNPSASVRGNLTSFESVFVLTSYVSLLLYAYEMPRTEEDLRILLRGFLVLAVLFGVIGLFQVFGCDLLNYDSFKRLVMSGEQFSKYADEIKNTFSDGYVYLTLYNPNYAGVMLSMLFAFFLTFAVYEKEQKRRVLFVCITALTAVLCFFTYARASLLTMAVSAFLIFIKKLSDEKKKGKIMVFFLLGCFVAALLLFGLDAAKGGRFWRRLTTEGRREPLTGMTTQADGIHFVYEKQEYVLAFDEQGELTMRSSQTVVEKQAEDGRLHFPFEGGEAYGSEETIWLYLADNLLEFEKTDEGYFYRAISGELVAMEEVERADFGGLEYLGSARLYIWSRVLPLLPRRFLIGSGPDTFAECFPQKDYAGKLIYSDDPTMVIEKAHNDYLNKWVQTGGVSVILLVLFYVFFLRKCRKAFGKKSLEGMTEIMGLGSFLAAVSYMLAGFFNDSTVQTTPVFCVFAGIALGCACREQEGK